MNHAGARQEADLPGAHGCNPPSSSSQASRPPDPGTPHVEITLPAVEPPLAATGQPLALVSGGVTDYTIVLDTTADRVERFAAEELQKYLRLMTGVELTIADLSGMDLSSRWDSLPIITIGRNDVSEALLSKAAFPTGTDAILIRSFGKALLLAGSNSRSTLFAVYDLLQRIGCRWTGPRPHGESVPRFQDLHLPPQNVSHAASLARRNVFITDDLPTSLDIDWMAKQKLNHFEAYLTYRFDIWEKLKHGLLQEIEKRGMSIEVTNHSYAFWIPPSQFGGDHPDYFALVDGNRLVDRSHRQYGSDPPHLCVSHPDVVRIVTERMLAFLKRNPEVETLGLWSNDNEDYCQCDACVAMDGGSPPPARRYLLFTNQVAELISKEFSDRKIAFIVTSTWKDTEAPRDVTPAENIFLWFTPISACYGHSIADPCCEINTSVRAYLEQWTGLFGPERVGILEFYDTDWAASFRHPGYEPMTHRLASDLEYYRGAGIAGVYAWPGSGHSVFGVRSQHELTINLVARLGWAGDSNLWEVVAEYSEAKYGDGASAMVEVYREIDQAARGLAGRHTTLGPGEIYSSELWKRLEPHFRQAFVDTSDEACAQGNVERFEAAIRSGRLIHERLHPDGGG